MSKQSWSLEKYTTVASLAVKVGLPVVYMGLFDFTMNTSPEMAFPYVCFLQTSFHEMDARTKKKKHQPLCEHAQWKINPSEGVGELSYCVLLRSWLR